MNITEIDKKIKKAVNNLSKESFVYDLISAYGLPKASISRLKKGGLNLSKVDGEILWKKKLFFKFVDSGELYSLIEDLKSNSHIIRHDPRFLILTDFNKLLSVDCKTKETLDIDFNDLPKHLDFFLPWAGMEKTQYKNENPADIKAAEKMAKLFDEIIKDNTFETPEEIHSLNVFMSRLLFCFFSEDSAIFEEGIFTNGISSHTQEDGSDLDKYFEKLFDVLNKSSRDNLPSYLAAFPYVNGGLFRKKHNVPKFTRKSRNIIIECGQLNWKEINPDIFGSMIQAVVNPAHRGGLGMHYTSVPNIMKVIEPLFLNELYEEFENSKNDPKKLTKLHDRISKIKIFDPACGSGNFLIIAYKELRILEMKILEQMYEIQKVASGFEPKQMELIPNRQMYLSAAIQINMFSQIRLSQFYGIEIDDFAHEIAILSLWLAEHQMNMKFKELFGVSNPSLPLREGGNIVQGNATRLDWERVCPKEKDDEIYIMGNPPYIGSRNQTKDQKNDMKIVLSRIKRFKKLDYISCWFYKLSKIVDNKTLGAFVSTSSICQGEQLDILWPEIIDKVQIFFAVQQFKWKNNAKRNAGVSVVIIGMSGECNRKKIIINEKVVKTVKNISPYLMDSRTLFIKKKKDNLSKLPEMSYGNYTGACNELMLDEKEKNKIIIQYPEVTNFIRPLKGADELLKGIERYCLWIHDEDLESALRIEIIRNKIEIIKEKRLKSRDKSMRKLANKSHQFRDMRESKIQSIIVPIVSSERREYLPCGFFTREFIIPNSAQAIFDPETFVFSILSSKIHLIWIKTVCGTLESRVRYSSTLGYNTFPFPPISENQKKELEKYCYRILEEREKYSEKTLAQLYDPDKMPEGLREAHHQNDLAVERCYRSKPFENDEERLEYLFKMYEQMVEEERKK